MNQTWTQDLPKETGVYWKRKGTGVNAEAQPVLVKETDLDPNTRPTTWGMTPDERHKGHIEYLKDLGTNEAVISHFNSLPAGFWEIWWCGPLECPPFPH